MFEIFIKRIGIIGLSFVIGTLTAVVSAMDRKNARLRTDISSLNRFRDQYNLSETQKFSEI